MTDENGTAIANQTVNVTVTDKDKASDYHSVVTNEKCIGTLKLDKDSGEYTVTVIYSGNDKYNGCNATKKITVEEVVEESGSNEQISSSESSSSSSASEDDGYGKLVLMLILNIIRNMKLMVNFVSMTVMEN